MTQQDPRGTALALDNPFTVLSKRLEAATPKLKQVLPTHISAEKIVRQTCAVLARTPALLECTPNSVLQSVMIAARLGLECDGILGSGYLVPFGRNIGSRDRPQWVKEAQFIPGYRGLIDLARRSGAITSMEAATVHEHDRFVYEKGLNPKLEHGPKIGKRGDFIGAYAIARFAAGAAQFDFMDLDELLAIKARGKGNKGFSPWDSDFGEMAKKTVIRRLSKLLPLSVELAGAMALQVGQEAGESQTSAVAEALDLNTHDALEGGNTALIETTVTDEKTGEVIAFNPATGEVTPPETEETKRGRGRPPGAKNKVKDEPAKIPDQPPAPAAPDAPAKTAAAPEAPSPGNATATASTSTTTLPETKTDTASPPASGSDRREEARAEIKLWLLKPETIPLAAVPDGAMISRDAKVDLTSGASKAIDMPRDAAGKVSDWSRIVSCWEALGVTKGNPVSVAQAVSFVLAIKAMKAKPAVEAPAPDAPKDW